MQKTHLPILCRIISTLIIVVSTSALTGCVQRSAEINKVSDAQALVDAITYVKAKNGLCFGVVTIQTSTNLTVGEGNLLVVVDCNKVGL
jgi:hypothetical protein